MHSSLNIDAKNMFIFICFKQFELSPLYVKNYAFFSKLRWLGFMERRHVWSFFAENKLGPLTFVAS